MKLPWTYWPIMFIAMLFAFAFGAAVGMSIGVNPYIAASLVMGALGLWETYRIARRYQS